jgi:ribose/xylose/arabinose/galactoside ABC-type transport system permease subunit
VPDPTSPNPPRPHKDIAPKPLWRRIFAAQESGLVVVIALMMVALTIFGGTKQASYRVEVPAGVKITQVDDTHVRIAFPAGEQTVVSDQPVRIKEGDGSATTIFASRAVNKFLDVENLLNVLTTASYYAIMAVGMTAIIILAGIDLSIGSIYAIAAILGAMLLSWIETRVKGGVDEAPGTSALIAVPILLLVCGSVGSLCGFVNGFSSVALRVHPFIITLGTMAIYRGAVFVFTQGQTVGGLPDSIQGGFFKWESHGVFPVPTAITLLVGLAGAIVLSRTVFGRRIYAIGGNEIAARYAGIPVGRIKTMVYTISGGLAGLAAAIYVGYFGAAENGAGQGYELNVIAAAVIGGASLSGGRGSAFGAVLGAVLVQLINNGMLILDINQSYNQIVMGLAIIIAVVVDQTKTRLTR